MNSLPDTDRDRAEDEAVTWLILLADDPADAALKARFEAWVSASPLHAELWARANHTWDVIGHGSPARAADWADFQPAPPPVVALAARRRRHWRLGLGIAAAALAACLTLVALPGILLRIEADEITTTAELRTVMLADGSRLHLGPESAVTIDMGADARRIRLLQGQAFFEVTPDAAHPFSVSAADTVTTVLGTAFDVQLTDDGAAIAVARGLVRVDDPSRTPAVTEQLKAGDWISLHGGDMRRGMTPADEVADWRQGEFVARDRSVAEVVDMLRPYFGGMILIRDEAFATRRVSGLYDLRDPVATLQGLAAAHGATLRQISPWLLVITGG